MRLPEGADQRAVMQAMLDAGISTRRGIMCSHREPAYAGPEFQRSLGQSEIAQDRSVLLPLFPGMTPAEQLHVCTVLRRACAHVREPVLAAQV